MINDNLDYAVFEYRVLRHIAMSTCAIPIPDQVITTASVPNVEFAQVYGPSKPIKAKCTYCGTQYNIDSTGDSRGNCIACGGPR